MDSEDEWLDVPEQEPGTAIEGDEAILEGDDDEPGTLGSSEDHLVIPFAASASEGTKGRRVPSRKEREGKLWLHKAHLLLWFVHARIRNRWANHPTLKAELRNLIPPEIAKLFESSAASRPPIALSSLKTLVSWWKKTFLSEKSDPQEIGKLELGPGESSGPDLLLTFAKSRRGPSNGLVLLFVCLCRALGLLARLVVSLQPVSFRFTVEELSKEASASQPPENQPNKRQKTSDSKDASPQRTETLYWCEVYSTDEARWIAIDPEQSKVDDPYSLEPPLGSLCPLRYVVGLQGDQMVKDVTRRYSGHWGARTKRLRMPDIFWWNNVLERFHPRLGPEFDRNRDNWEDAELETREKTEILPKSFDEFKRHPLYALERHLKKTEALKSTEVVLGHFRGEPVYPRSEVKTLRSSLAWMKLAREINPAEKPIKLVKGRTMSKGKKDDEGPSSATQIQQETPLYGFWQTRPYSTQVAKNGVVPKNQYGRVDLYQESMLPEGTVHLTYPNAKELARRFGIDYAEAVISIEFTRGRMVPKIDGIVVCQEFEEILREACVEKTQIKQEKERRTREQEVLARWKKLTQGLLLRERFVVLFYYIILLRKATILTVPFLHCAATPCCHHLIG